MARSADDRDGLTLDQLCVRVGPFFPHFPPGLRLEVKLQGDVVQEASTTSGTFADLPADRASTTRTLFRRALNERVKIRDLELARAAHHLGGFAKVLGAHGLPGLGERCRRLSTRAEDLRPQEIRALQRLVERLRVLPWATRGIGRIPRERIAGRGLGPVARASGLDEDARSHDPEYVALGFQPIVGSRGDALGRWRQRLQEAAASLQLAERAGERRTGGTGEVESPWGRLSVNRDPISDLLPMLPGLLEGLDWGDAVTTIVSLDLDLEGEARA
jgi:NADH:ubiquinone oxidoreductase subunit D